MTDDPSPATEPNDPATNNAPPDAPRHPRWRKIVKMFLITLAFTTVVDLGAKFVASRGGGVGAAQALKSFGQSVEYGLESVQVFALLRRASTRLGNDRYHTAVTNLKTPFNLSEACRDGAARSGVYGIEVSNLCFTPPPPLYRNPLESPRVFVLPTLPTSPVDEKKYPRSAFKETILGLPDAIRYTLACAWDGKDYCVPPRTGEPPRSNWFGKLLLVAAAVFALAVTLGANKPPGDETPKLFSFVVIFFVSLFYAGAACAVVLLLVKGLAELGLWLSGVFVTVAGFRMAGVVFDALKDLAADQVKDYVAKKV